MNKLISGLLLLCLFALPGHVRAADKADPAKEYIDALKKVLTDGTYDDYEKQITGLLLAGDYASLDDYFAKLQGAYEAGAIDDVLLDFAFSPLLEHEDPWSVSPPRVEYEAKYNEWVAKSPDSYAAHLLAANYHAAVSRAIRAHRYPGLTEAGEDKGATERIKKAADENEESFKHAKKPLLSYANALELEKSNAGTEASKSYVRAAAKDILDHADKLDPANLTARRVYMTLLSPRWFGNAAAMQDYVGQLKKESLPQGKAEFLEGIMYAEIARSYYEHADLEGARLYAQKGATYEFDYLDYDFGQDALKIFIHVSHDRWQKDGTSLNDQSYLGALDLLLKPGRHVKNPGFYYGQRAKIRWDYLHEIPEAWADFQKGLSFGDAYSAYSVAQAYCVGKAELNIQVSMAKCSESMTAAADLGSPDADSFLDSLAKADFSANPHLPR
ncbi:MAG TPA: hypothetical protein VL625_07580 [Patescibacteria group bacterium]|nr:hypothetical protein [Patescibacteria group bacterium]